MTPHRSPHRPVYPPAYGYALYARSHALPRTVATLLGTAFLAAVCAHQLTAYLDPQRRIPVVALAPMFAASAIGTGLHQHSAELDRTAVRAAWPRRLAHLLALTALAAGTLALAVPGHAQEFGAFAMVRNLLGAVGITAVSAAVTGARLSWLPTVAYLSAVYLAGGHAAGRAATVWAWPVQPGPQPAAWACAALVFLLGAVLHAVRGPRPRDAGD
ncbi:hypothetical protein [Streptomyces lydicus]|uniref:hypothetical protein n=1 Tax=Streptomyces lydicus TaxID=47763 RepID=UPI0037ABF5FB